MTKSRKTSPRAAQQRPAAEVGDTGRYDVMRVGLDAEERAALRKLIQESEAPSTKFADWFARERKRLRAEEAEDRPLSADDQAVADQSAENRRRILNDLFEEPYWPLERVLLWIAFRTRNVFDESFLSAMQAAKTYARRQDVRYQLQELWCKNPRRELLRALQQKGGIGAVRNRAVLPCEAWATATERQGWMSADRFQRDEVMARWQTTKRSPETQTGKRGRKPAMRDHLVHQMREQIKNNKLTVDQLESIGGQLLAESYGVHRDTSNSAREIVLAEIRASRIAAN